MKKIIFLAAALAVVSAKADVNYFKATQQAHRVVDQNNAEQQRVAQEAAGPADPALAATLQNINDLKADLDAIVNAADATAGAARRTPLLNDLSAASAAGKKAKADSVKKLADQLINVLSGKKNLALQDLKLARSLHALFNAAHLTAAQQESLLTGFKKVLTDAGVAADDADGLVSALKQIVSETL
jgi:hypothetical protein